MVSAHFRFLHGAHDNGTLFLFLTTLKSPFGDMPWLDAADGGVGVIATGFIAYLCTLQAMLAISSTL